MQISTTCRQKITKWLFVFHLLLVLACVILLFTLKSSEHLRWGLGYIIVWATLLSAVILFFFVDIFSKYGLPLKMYCLSFLAIVGGFLVFFQTEGWGSLIIPVKYCDDGDYLVRSEIDSPFDHHIVLLKNEGAVEKLICVYYYPSADSIKVFEDKGAVVIYCSEDYLHSTGSKGCIEPLNVIIDDNMETEIEALAKELNVDINQYSFQF